MEKALKSLKKVTVILASDASWRSEILSRLGVAHLAVSHRYKEPKANQTQKPVDLVKTIAKGKALSVAQDHPRAIIISSDQLIALDDNVFGKPGNKKKAAEQLGRLQGSTHRLYCALAVCLEGRISVQTEISRLTMRPLSQSEIDYYLEHDQPYQCAGSYKIESLGASLFSSIETADPNSIIGLPGNRLVSLLRENGYSNLI